VDIDIRNFRLHDLPGVACLWNAAAADAYGFHPLSAETFLSRIVSNRYFDQRKMLLAFAGDMLVGMCHGALVTEPYYQDAGVVECVLVHPKFRGRGVAGELLDNVVSELAACGAQHIKGGGAWPYTPFYSTLIDGSERSGVFHSDTAAIRAYQKAGFRPGRESLVMRKTLTSALEHEVGIPKELHIEKVGRVGCSTWLDDVFRGWNLQNHYLVRKDGFICSRAIFSRMDGLSDFSGRERYALFGVNTPDSMRGRGYAYANLANTVDSISRLGGHEIELHVYADNLPAVNLYRKLGFEEIAKTICFER
jgi:ribosomal protein S18 acetylase RimI-like enzyme